LVAAGADVNIRNASLGTPLHEAAFYGREEMGALLLSAGAKDPLPDSQGFCARHAALKCNYLPVIVFAVHHIYMSRVVVHV
jgi:ankyrin repeat protein